MRSLQQAMLCFFLLCSVLAVPTAPIQAAPNRDTFKIAGPGRFPGFDSAGDLVVWQTEESGPIYAANPADRRVIEVAPAVPGQVAPETDGEWVFWRVFINERSILQGKNMLSGATFTANDTPERITQVVLIPGMVVWVRIVDDTNELVARRLGSADAPFVLATTEHRIGNIVANGPRLLWNEIPANQNYTLKLLDVTSNQAPTRQR